jgi:hypothetical protein
MAKQYETIFNFKGEIGGMPTGSVLIIRDEIAPTITSVTSISIAENTMGTIYTASADEPVAFTFGSSKDENLFTLSTDEISFNTVPDFESPTDRDENNIYELDLTATDGTGNSSIISINITVTDVDEVLGNKSLSEQLRIFPNPATSQFKLSISNKINADQLLIYNQKGSLIKKYKVNHENTYQIEGLISGIYKVVLKEDGKKYNIGSLLIKK